MTYIFTVIILLFVGVGLYNLFSSILTFNKRRRKLEEFSLFNKTVLNWVDEIEDSSMKMQFLNYCSNLVTLNYEVMLHEYMDGEDKISEIKEDIFMRFGDHIPSLKKEFRDKKLEKILS